MEIRVKDLLLKIVFNRVSILVLALLASGSVCFAESLDPRAALRGEIETLFPSAEIEVEEIALNGAPGNEQKYSKEDVIRNVQEAGPGKFTFLIGETSGTAKVKVWRMLYTARSRLSPHHVLRDADLELKRVNLLDPQVRPLRTVLLREDSKISSLETRQTILAGQFITDPAVRKIPDIQRGEIVRVEMHSGRLRLRSNGKANEEAYIGDEVHITVDATKKNITGKVIDKGLVEVTI